LRHRKHTFKLNRTGSHRRALIANLLKSLIEHERIATSVPKAKELKRHADRLITLAKKGTLAGRRRAAALLSVAGKNRSLVNKLFTDLGPRFKERNGGYTRIVRTTTRVGDNSENCIISWV